MRKSSETFKRLSTKHGIALNSATTKEDGLAQIPAEVSKILSEVGTVLNSAITTQDAKEVLGEPWFTQLKDIHGQLNASLKGMPLTEQVPAAQEAYYMLGHVKSQFLYLQNTVTNLLGALKAKNQEAGQVLASAPKAIEEAIKAKVDSGELIAKETVTDLVTKNRAEGVTEGLNKGKLRSDRLMVLATAKVAPEIASAFPDDILLGEQAAFDVAKDLTIYRVEKLSGVGLALASMQNLVFEAPEKFDAQLATYNEIAQKAKGTALNSAPAPEAKPTQKPSGFIGGGGAASAKPANVVLV